jgi:hypothetical protein
VRGRVFHPVYIVYDQGDIGIWLAHSNCHSARTLVCGLTADHHLLQLIQDRHNYYSGTPLVRPPSAPGKVAWLEGCVVSHRVWLKSQSIGFRELICICSTVTATLGMLYMAKWDKFGQIARSLAAFVHHSHVESEGVRTGWGVREWVRTEVRSEGVRTGVGSEGVRTGVGS